MPNVALTNLTSGELSPIMLGRPDVARYGNGCLRLENYLLTTTGMFSFRPGFGLMGFPKNPGAAVRLRRFQFSDEQGYVLELGVGYFRVWHTLGLVLNASTQTPVDVVTPFTVEELPLLGFAQSADVLFVISEVRGVLRIERRAHDNWRIQAFPLKDGPYGPVNTDADHKLTFDAVTGDIGVEAVGFGGDPPFAAGDEGRVIRVLDGAAWRWLIIKEVIDSTHVVATLQKDKDGLANFTSIAAGAEQKDFRFGLFSDRLGWPCCGHIAEQRLVLGGPAAIPDRIDGSAIGGYDDYGPRDPITDDGPYAYALGLPGVNRIVGLASSNDLIAFTVGSEHRIAGDSTGAAITPTAIWQKPISPGGAKRIEAVHVGNSLAYVDKYGLNIRAITFDLRFQNYAPDNLTLLADHMSGLEEESPGFQGLNYQANPIGTIWTIRGNGELAGAAYAPTESVLGWHRHPLGSAAGEVATVDSIEVMKGPRYDELWAVVRRELPGRLLHTIERLGRPGLWDAPHERQCWLDCSLKLRNTPTASLTPGATSGDAVAFVRSEQDGFDFVASDVGRFIKRRYVKGRNLRGGIIYVTAVAEIIAWVSASTVTCRILVPFPSMAKMTAGQWGLTVAEVSGLDHFEGLQVVSVSDGRVCSPKTVTAGRIALDVPGWEVSAGLGYDGYMVSMPLDPGPSAVIGQGRDVRVPSVRLRVLNSIGGEFASVPERDEEPVRWEMIQPYSQGAAAPSAVPMPISGVRKVWAAGEWTREGQVAIRQTQPLPLNVQLMVVHAYAPFVQP